MTLEYNPKPFNPPRGSWDNTAQAKAPLARWMNPARLEEPQWKEGAGKILLGRNEQGQNIAYSDDRHLVTIAGSRAGKTATMLIPNLCRYAGSVLVIDPKGELAEKTAAHRAAMGHKVHILDPFGEVEKNGKLRTVIEQKKVPITDKSAGFNPFDEFKNVSKEDLWAEVSAFCDSLIVSTGNDPYWGDAARNVLHSVILYLLTEQTKHEASLETVAKFFANKDVHDSIYVDMYECEAYDGFLKGIAAQNLAKSEGASKEYDSILSNGNSQLSSFMGFRKGILSKSDFSLSDLKKEPTTIYLVLPAGKMGSHYRWLRMIITLALSALERDKTKPEHPVLFVLEEFAALGYMRPIEQAAGYMAGFGVKLWPILQDLQQLKTHYKDSWQTFLGNAGMLQVFGLNDGATEEFISQRLGTTQYEDEEPMHYRTSERYSLTNPPVKRIGNLLEPHEVRLLFSRETWRQIIIFSASQTHCTSEASL